jgi:hypothetical protein
MAKKATRQKARAASDGGQFALKFFAGNFDRHDQLTNASGSATVGFIVAAPASKSVAVSAAVTSQLYHDGRWPPVDFTAVMNGPYRYTRTSMRNFLDGVRGSLAASHPPYRFTWDSAFVTKLLPLSVAATMAEIERATS